MSYDPNIWTINGQTFAALGINSPRLKLENGRPDIFSWQDPKTAFDADLRWAYDTEIVLARGGTAWFRGHVRRTPRFMGSRAESIDYVAHGAYAKLAEKAYLQKGNFTTDPATEGSPLEQKRHGRVVLGLLLNLAGEGQLVNIDQQLEDILTTADAGITVGDITGLDWPVPLDEAVDLQCSDATGRVLQWAPDVVEWFEHTSTTTTYRAGRWATLEPVNILIPAPGEGGVPATGYVPLESVSLDPAYELQAAAVVLFFRRSTDSTYTIWETLEKQAAPPSATGAEPRAIVRTLELAGATAGGTRLAQPVRTEPLSTLLATTGTVLPASTDAFNALSTFWKRKVPRLGTAGSTITGFRACTRKRNPGGADDPNQSATPTTACDRELVEGAITDWMLQQQPSLKVEEQELACEVSFTETVDGVVFARIERYTTKVTATAATTKIYRQRGGFVEVGEPEEPAMPGLAQKIYDGVKDLHYRGSFVYVEPEATLTVRPGKVVNLTGSRTEWATMRALVQSVEVVIDEGRTTVTVGPPSHLGANQVQELFRSNRTKRDVTSAYAKVSGRGSEGIIPVTPP